MSNLLTLAAPALPLLCVVKASAALVLFEVRAWRVVVGTILRFPAKTTAGKNNRAVAIARIPFCISSPAQMAADVVGSRHHKRNRQYVCLATELTLSVPSINRATKACGEECVPQRESRYA